MNDYRIINDSINLDKSYVVTKLFSGNVYFTRERMYGGFICDTVSPFEAYVFADKQQAELWCDKFNYGRKKVKHKIEKASSFFTTNIEFKTSWYDSSINIENKYVPVNRIKRLNKLGTALNDVEKNSEILKTYTQKATDELESTKKHLEELDFIKKQSIERAEEIYKRNTKRCYEKMVQQRQHLKDLKELDYEQIVKEFKTSQDKKYEILYGSVK